MGLYGVVQCAPGRTDCDGVKAAPWAAAHSATSLLPCRCCEGHQRDSCTHTSGPATSPAGLVELSPSQKSQRTSRPYCDISTTEPQPGLHPDRRSQALNSATELQNRGYTEGFLDPALTLTGFLNGLCFMKKINASGED